MNNNDQNSKRSDVSSSSELPWLSFCYVANELDSQTRREFEIRLEHDQTAREAVARAFDDVQLLDRALAAQAVASETGELQTATLELPQPPSQPLRSTKSKRFWPFLLAALGLAGVIAIVLPQLFKPSTTAQTSRQLTNVCVPLAEAWADSDWHTESATEIADIETDLIDDEDEPDNSDHELIEDFEQDDWMTATLVDMAKESNSLTL